MKPQFSTTSAVYMYKCVYKNSIITDHTKKKICKLKKKIQREIANYDFFFFKY